MENRRDETPLWREEFAFDTAREKYVNRRQFAKFLVLTSLAMFVGNLWIWLKGRFARTPVHPERPVAKVGEIPVGGTKQFRYPGERDPCLLIHYEEGKYAAYSQKCTHLACPVYYETRTDRLECPCHEGYFSVRDGRVLQGPPPRPLPKVRLERRGGELFAVGIDPRGGE